MKRVIKTLLFSISILFLCITTTFAQPSISIDDSIIVEVLVDGEKRDGMTVKFVEELTNVDPPIISIIEKLNSGMSIDEVLKEVELYIKDNLNLDDFNLDDFKMLTELKNLVAYDADGNILKNVTVTWEVANLAKDLGDIYVLHYSTVRDLWEIIKPLNVDFDNKTITAEFEDLSPVAVIYKANNSIITGEDGNNGAAISNLNSKTLGYIGISFLLLLIILSLYKGNKKTNKKDFNNLSK